MKIGILGGTFNPVHYGHLVMADTARIALQLDEVRFVPNRVSPFKTAQAIPDGHARADMLRLAVAGYPEFVVDRREIRRDGPSFTVDTLQSLKDEFPQAELFFLLGADAVRDFASWRQPARIVELARLVVFPRPGSPVPHAERILEWIGPELAPHVVSLPMPGCAISSSEIRERFRQGCGARFLMPRAAEEFAVQHRLYAP